MNLTILFYAVSTLSFSIYYNIDGESTQDFFIFEGNNCTVHLYRENSTLFLYQRKNGNYITYSMQNIGSTFNFTWNGYLINGMEMTSDQSVNIGEMNFETFTFISPLIDINFYTDIFQGNSKESSYGILLIVIVILALLELSIWCLIISCPIRHRIDQ